MYMKKEHLLKTIHLKHHTSFFLIVGHSNVEQEFNSVSYKSPISGRLFKIYHHSRTAQFLKKTFSLCYLVDQVRVSY